MRFTVRISFFAALEAALGGPASTSEVAGTVHNSNGDVVSGDVVMMTAARSSL
jgi:hypothetical protein